MTSVISIGLGAIFGALLRWKMAEHLNFVFPTIPIGTLLANLLGCFVMGSLIFLTREHSFFPYEVRLGLITGFLGSLTTFSTFSAEALNLFARQELSWLSLLIALHVGGSILMAALGYSLTKLFFHLSAS